MFETLGSYSWQTVHMSIQNGSIAPGNLMEQIFDSHFSIINLKVCLYREAMQIRHDRAWLLKNLINARVVDSAVFMQSVVY